MRTMKLDTEAAPFVVVLRDAPSHEYVDRQTGEVRYHVDPRTQARQWRGTAFVPAYGSDDVEVRIVTTTEPPAGLEWGSAQLHGPAQLTVWTQERRGNGGATETQSTGTLTFDRIAATDEPGSPTLPAEWPFAEVVYLASGVIERGPDRGTRYVRVMLPPGHFDRDGGDVDVRIIGDVPSGLHRGARVIFPHGVQSALTVPELDMASRYQRAEWVHTAATVAPSSPPRPGRPPRPASAPSDVPSPAPVA